MAAMLAVVAVLVSLLHRGHCLSGAFDASTITCDPEGFEPVFTYNPAGQTQDVAIDIDIGSDADTKCEAAKAMAEITSNVQVIKTDFDAGFSARIPFLNDAVSPSTMCGGTLVKFTDTDDSNKEKIKYEVTATAIVTRKFRDKVYRKLKYPFKLVCVLTKEQDAITSDVGFSVLTALIEADGENVASGTFDFGATLKFYNSGYTTAETSAVSVNNEGTLYLLVESTTSTTLFKFVVDQCYSTVTDNDPAVAAGKKDVFFDDQCHLDETVDFSTVSGKFRIEVGAFTYPSPDETATYYFHCSLTVCLTSNTDAACTQGLKSACSAPANNRRRRSIEKGEVFHKTITSSQPVLLRGAQFFAPTCGQGQVYDREIKMCSRKDILEIRGIVLREDVFKREYYNTSSVAYRQMAMTKEYQLWVLIKATRQNRIIRGVKIIRASPGSLVLDVLVKYTDSITPEEAFETFEKVLRAPATTARVQKILKIDYERTIEYVPIVVGGSVDDEAMDSDKLILIIVVAILFVVVSIAGVTLFKVRKLRQSSSTGATTSVGVVNKGVDA